MGTSSSLNGVYINVNKIYWVIIVLLVINSKHKGSAGITDESILIRMKWHKGVLSTINEILQLADSRSSRVIFVRI